MNATCDTPKPLANHAFSAHGLARRGRAWRKRKNGHRWANGNIKQPNAAQRHKTAQELIDLEKSVVLAQPHRRGDRNQLCESPLGRLVLRRKLSLVIYDAPLEYGRRLRRWLTQRGRLLGPLLPNCGCRVCGVCHPPRHNCRSAGPGPRARGPGANRRRIEIAGRTVRDPMFLEDVSRDERQVVNGFIEFRGHASRSNGHEANSGFGGRNLQA
jgi:hypothetical protein